MRLIRLLLSILMICAVTAHAAAQPREVTSKQAQAQQIDPCKLLSGDEIKSVQGDTLEQTTPGTEPASNGLRGSHCLYRTKTPVKSVSVAVASGSRKRVREYWRKQFHRGREKEQAGKAGDNKQSSREEDEESEPRMVKSVGDEAYWLGNRMIGVLYVLRGNAFIRVSVGGVPEEAARLEKSVALARAALKRLQ